ncbi:Hypothetical protein I595_803 [Croceitalea dokdonensis DOKDO 023]|uniref:Uncharacterized protein n=1 Tax=Croceitalea dokdonensis DOKDO 023 TaxID=1300341 RepID=A0A0P7B2D5_9FLAO|nr:Hypothetical protein I595_803 [Croceitalea dokdonensis DOKDO 023]
MVSNAHPLKLDVALYPWSGYLANYPKTVQVSLLNSPF